MGRLGAKRKLLILGKDQVLVTHSFASERQRFQERRALNIT